MGMANDWQLFSLFLAVGCGFLLGFTFDLLRVFRAVFHSSPIAVFVQDVLFCVCGAVAVFFFLLPLTGGEVRAYLLFGVCLGMLTYLTTMGRVLPRLCQRFMKAIQRFTAPLQCFFERRKRNIEGVWTRTTVALCRGGRFCAKKVKFFIKKGLHIGG